MIIAILFLVSNISWKKYIFINLKIELEAVLQVFEICVSWANFLCNHFPIIFIL